MLKNKYYQKFLATLFVAVYLFVALFSQNFHNHSSGEVYKDFHFTKFEKTITKSSLVANYTDCLSCHILYTGKYIVDSEFSLTFFQPLEFRQKSTTHGVFFLTKLPKDYFVRGPPFLFI